MPSLMNMEYHGSFTLEEANIEKMLNFFKIGKLDKYGKLGVEYLKEYTPKRTGLTSESWTYDVKRTSSGFEIVWKNTNIQNGEEIAMILQYGHGTGTGGWVEGVDYINPALKELFEKIEKDARKEVFGVL